MPRRLLLAIVLAVVGLGGLAAFARFPERPAPATTGPVGTFVEVEGLRLHAVCAGAGKGILLIHGNPGNFLTWQDTLLPRLAARHRVCAVDRPGHGFSERRSGPADTVEGQARMLHRAGRGLGLRRPLLVGHSWGGAAALAFALEFPKDVAGLVLLGAVAYPDDSGFAEGAEKVALHPVVGPVVIRALAPLLAEPLLDRSLKLSFAPDAVPAAYRARALPLWVRPQTLRAISADEAALDVSLEAMYPRYGEIRIPTAILVGDADRLVDPARHSFRLREALPRATLTVLPGAGHELQHTRTEAVADAIHSLRARAR